MRQNPQPTPGGPALPPPTPAHEAQEPQARTNGHDRARSKLLLEGIPARRPLWQRALKAVGWAALVAATLVGAVGAGLYYHFSEGLPDIPRVDGYWPPIVTEVYT